MDDVKWSKDLAIWRKKDFTPEAKAKAWNMINKMEKAFKDNDKDRIENEAANKAVVASVGVKNSKGFMLDRIQNDKRLTAKQKNNAIKIANNQYKIYKDAEEESNANMTDGFLKAIDGIRSKKKNPNIPILLKEVVNTPSARVAYNGLSEKNKKIFDNALNGIRPKRTDDKLFNELFITGKSPVWNMNKEQAYRVVKHQTTEDDFKLFKERWEAKDSPTKMTSRSELDKVLRDSLVAIYSKER